MKRRRFWQKLEKRTGVLLAVVLCITMVSADGLWALDLESEGVPSEEGRVELTELREVNKKYYELSDGSYQCVVSSDFLHYLTKDGYYEEINNTLVYAPETVGENEYLYRNEANKYTVYFGEAGGSYPICVEFDESTLFMRVEADSYTIGTEYPLPEVLYGWIDPTASIVYHNTATGIDCLYEAKPAGVKEYLILNNVPENNTFACGLAGDRLSFIETQQGVGVQNENGETKFNLTGMVAYDSQERATSNISYGLTEGEETALSMTVDADWLYSGERSYPVVIDPSILVSGSDCTYDACIVSMYPNTNYYLDVSLRTGYDEDFGARRSYIKFDLPSGVTSSTLTGAYIRLKKHGGDVPTAYAHRINSEWSSSTLTWNNRPYYSDEMVSPQCFDDGDSWYAFDITDIAEEWYSGERTNFGVLIKDSNEENINHWSTYWSSDASYPNRPEMIVYYSGSSGGGGTGGGSTGDGEESSIDLSDNQFLATGSPNSTIFFYSQTYDSPWNSARNQSFVNWNSAGTPARFYLSEDSNNQIIVFPMSGSENYGERYYDYNSQSYTIYLNSIYITQDADEGCLNNFIQSVLVHELGHILWLADNPNTSSPSIMKRCRNRNVMTQPSAYDAANVSYIYGGQ